MEKLLDGVVTTKQNSSNCMANVVLLTEGEFHPASANSPLSHSMFEVDGTVTSPSSVE